MEELTAMSRLLPTPPGAGLTCAEVREAVREALSSLKAPPGWIQDVLTVATELVSNARRHAGGVAAFRIAARPQSVTVEVSDRSRDRPRTRPWAPDRPGGFGWRLVNTVADATDVRVHHSGKTVTATFAAPPC